MPKTRNPIVYRATLTGLIGKAFGVEQIFAWNPEIEIYQARVSPELWRARPNMERLGHKWEASTVEDLMRIITADFTGVVKPWVAIEPSGAVRHKPSLFRSGTQGGGAGG